MGVPVVPLLETESSSSLSLSSADDSQESDAEDALVATELAGKRDSA